MRPLIASVVVRVPYKETHINRIVSTAGFVPVETIRQEEEENDDPFHSNALLFRNFNLH